MIDETIPLIALLFVLCMLCQWIAWRVRLPAIIFLLLTGIIAGPVLAIIDPEELVGDLLFPFVSLAVAIILFEGSLTLKIREMQGLHAVVRNMVSFGMLTTWLITTIAGKLFADISWEVAAVFGAIMVVTGPTVVAPILRSIRPTASVANILKWESIVIDPIGASLAVLVFEFIISGGWQQAISHTLVTFGALLFVGTSIGIIAGYLFGLALRYHFIPEFLHNISTLAVVFASFALSNFIQAESGLVTVTVCGIWLANMRDVDLERILAFKETLSILLISILFIILAARLDFSSLQQLGWKALLILAIIQFIARPLNIIISTLGSTLQQRERHFLAWVAPRGIVAAAISSLFALKLERYGFEDAGLLVPLTFMVILGTVLFQSLTAGPIAKLLRLSRPEPDGFLIIGSNRVARTIAKALKNHGYHTLVTDVSKNRITEADHLGIPTYLGNPISLHAEHYLDTSGIGTLLALSANESENIATALHFRNEFGKNNIYTLLSTPQGLISPHLQSMPQLRGKRLFGEKAGYSLLSQMIAKGAGIYDLQLDQKFEPHAFHRRVGEDSLPLFAIDNKRKIHCFNSERPPHPDKGWIIIYLAFAAESEPVVSYHI